MIQAIIFSKDRAAQLDLLLRGMKENSDGIFSPHVIYLATSKDFSHGYDLCRKHHHDVEFLVETDFRRQTRALVDSSDFDYIAHFCDDDVFVRPLTGKPQVSLYYDKYLLTVSLRLGLNTTECYSLGREQGVPEMKPGWGGMAYWKWSVADADWGYPGSLDGNIFRRNLLLEFYATSPSFSNPNQLEERLVAFLPTVNYKPLMACYPESIITGCPVNLVNTTHPNRYGNTFQFNQYALNTQYLGGGRLIATVPEVRAAHTEMELRFSER